MKYAHQRSSAPHQDQAQVLIEALPWIKNATGKTIVIKYGGAAMTNPALRDAVMGDIVMLKIMGVNPVIVHGGGNAISQNMRRFGLEVEFRGGQRVTTPEAMDVVKMTLIGKVNEELVMAMNAHGNLAVGVSGADAGTLVATPAAPGLGRVGRVSSVNAAYLNTLIAADYVPIIASVAKGAAGPEEPGAAPAAPVPAAAGDVSYNVNADAAASAIASAIGAHKIIFLTDVDGYYTDFADKTTLVSQMSLDEARELLASGTVSSGMIPKLQSCTAALEGGVPRAHIVNGTVPHSLLVELLTSEGIGTLIAADGHAHAHMHTQPLGTLASRLSGNL